MHYMDGTAVCLDVAMTREGVLACAGQGATLCMDTETDGYTTLGMMFCSLAEYEAWDRLLNTTYGAAIIGMRNLDADDMERFAEFAVRAGALRDAQQAWIPLRDADCSLEYSMWGAGSMRQIAGASCLRHTTAERTVFLQFLGAEMRGE